jgi:hypothetical protein
MSVMLGLSLVMGSAALVFGQDKQTPPTKADSKDKGDKKGKADKGKDGKDEKGKDEKGKADKGKN